MRAVKKTRVPAAKLDPVAVLEARLAETQRQLMVLQHEAERLRDRVAALEQRPVAPSGGAPWPWPYYPQFRCHAAPVPQ